MTEEKKSKILAVIKSDSNKYLLERYVWYCQNFNPVDDDFIEQYQMIKEEILRRMEDN